MEIHMEENEFEEVETIDIVLDPNKDEIVNEENKKEWDEFNLKWKEKLKESGIFNNRGGTE